MHHFFVYFIVWKHTPFKVFQKTLFQLMFDILWGNGIKSTPLRCRTHMVYSNTGFRSNTDIFNNIGETRIFLLYSSCCQFSPHIYIYKWDFFSKYFFNLKWWKCIIWIWFNKHIILFTVLYTECLKKHEFERQLWFLSFTFTSMILFKNLVCLFWALERISSIFQFRNREFRPYFNLERENFVHISI